MRPRPLRPKPRPRAPSIGERLGQLHRVLHAVVTHMTRLDRRTKEILMALADLTATLAKIDAATDNIAADIKGLKALIVPGMSQADVDTVQTKLDAAATRLEGIAADTADPVPGV
jgi:hypothetical protein